MHGENRVGLQGIIHHIADVSWTQVGEGPKHKRTCSIICSSADGWTMQTSCVCIVIMTCLDW